MTRNYNTFIPLHSSSTYEYGQRLLGSFTGTVASYNITEASLGMLS